MSRRLPLPPPGFDELSVDEKVEYVQSLWDRIAANEEQVPVPEWHKEVLRERMEELESDPSNSADWKEVRDRLERQLREKGSGR